ncbi:MAG: hypothetical protein ACLUUO_04945 [Sellimonas intestinalis]
MKKIVELAVVLLLISFFSFAVIYIAPGDISSMYISQEMTDEQKEAVLEHLGMDKSMPEQYLGWLKQAVKGILGLPCQSYFRDATDFKPASRNSAFDGDGAFFVHCTCDPSRTLVRVSEKQLGR